MREFFLLSQQKILEKKLGNFPSSAQDTRLNLKESFLRWKLTWDKEISFNRVKVIFVGWKNYRKFNILAKSLTRIIYCSVFSIWLSSSPWTVLYVRRIDKTFSKFTLIRQPSCMSWTQLWIQLIKYEISFFTMNNFFSTTTSSFYRFIFERLDLSCLSIKFTI